MLDGKRHVHGVDYQKVSADYLHKRQLKSGSAGWVLLALVAVMATFLVNVTAALITAGIFVASLAYFWFYSRHRLVANAPEEEFEAIERAEAELV
ncbi:hypothetical protein [Streptosporangium sp. NPDC000396]|uniref:hypothetical protein n=1 Tax=Streptosporangium sp. NPDC000396 TaxID=3366185 RepID=UPI003695FEC1